MVNNLNTQKTKSSPAREFHLFSEKQIKNIVELVNHDPQVERLGRELKVTLTMAFKINETGEAHRFNFKDGKIIAVVKGEDAEFIISGPEKVWRQIKNRKIDPFEATAKKKLKLKGNFMKLFGWHEPFSRIFELCNKASAQ